MFASKFKITVVFAFLFFLAGLMSCNKSKQTSGSDSESIETEAIDASDFNEKDEDLLSVDYKEFYDELAPYGEWIEVTDKDIDLSLKKSSAGSQKSHRTISLSQLFGVKDAYADDVAFGAFFIWQPSPNIAVSVVAGEPAPAYYVPYSNGQWIYTDAGWYFMAPTPYEEVVHHHGRWVFSPALGWVWVPGRVWAPAWVEWRVGFGYVGWEPLPPSIYIVNNYIVTPPIYEDRFIIVENRYFCETQIYRYNYIYNGHGDRIMIKNMTRVDGVMVRDNMVFNQGPDVSMIEKDRGSKLDMVKLTKVDKKGDYKFDGKELKSYSPEFKRAKDRGDGKTSVTKPGKFESFSDAKNRSGKNEQFTQKGNNGGNTKDNYSKGNDKGGSKTDGSRGKDNNSKGNEKGNTRKSENNKNYDYGKQKDWNSKGNRKSDNNYDKSRRKNDGGNYDKGQKNKGGNYDKGRDKGGNYDKGQNKGGNDRKKFNRKQSQKDYNGKSYDKGKKNFNYRSENYGKQNGSRNNLKKYSRSNNSEGRNQKYGIQKTQKENYRKGSNSSGSNKRNGKR